jgi:hypothetical protein
MNYLNNSRLGIEVIDHGKNYFNYFFFDCLILFVVIGNFMIEIFEGVSTKDKNMKHEEDKNMKPEEDKNVKPEEDKNVKPEEDKNVKVEEDENVKFEEIEKAAERFHKLLKRKEENSDNDYQENPSDVENNQNYRNLEKEEVEKSMKDEDAVNKKSKSF